MRASGSKVLQSGWSTSFSSSWSTVEESETTVEDYTRCHEVQVWHNGTVHNRGASGICVPPPVSCVPAALCRVPAALSFQCDVPPPVSCVPPLLCPFNVVSHQLSVCSIKVVSVVTKFVLPPHPTNICPINVVSFHLCVLRCGVLLTMYLTKMVSNPSAGCPKPPG